MLQISRDSPLYTPKECLLGEGNRVFPVVDPVELLGSSSRSVQSIIGFDASPCCHRFFCRRPVVFQQLIKPGGGHDGCRVVFARGNYERAAFCRHIEVEMQEGQGSKTIRQRISPSEMIITTRIILP